MAASKSPLILIDRDGVINDPTGHYYILTPEDFTLFPDVIKAFQLLHKHKIPWAVITNQGGVGKGLMTNDDLTAIHDRFRALLKENGLESAREQIMCCIDDPRQPSTRRKPNPTMLNEAMTLYGRDKAHTHMIGDDIRDLEAAFNAGVHRHLVLTGHGEKTRANPDTAKYAPVTVHKNLYEAVVFIINSEK